MKQKAYAKKNVEESDSEYEMIFKLNELDGPVMLPEDTDLSEESSCEVDLDDFIDSLAKREKQKKQECAKVKNTNLFNVTTNMIEKTFVHEVRLKFLQNELGAMN